jgi:hypothetical protein
VTSAAAASSADKSKAGTTYVQPAELSAVLPLRAGRRRRSRRSRQSVVFNSGQEETVLEHEVCGKASNAGESEHTASGSKQSLICVPLAMFRTTLEERQLGGTESV